MFEGESIYLQVLMRMIQTFLKCLPSVGFSRACCIGLDCITNHSWIFEFKSKFLLKGKKKRVNVFFWSKPLVRMDLLTVLYVTEQGLFHCLCYLASPILLFTLKRAIIDFYLFGWWGGIHFTWKDCQSHMFRVSLQSNIPNWWLTSISASFGPDKLG